MKSSGEKVFSISIYIFLILFVLFCFLPFWLVFINSFSDESDILTRGYQLWPLKFSFKAYEYLIQGKQLYKSLGVSIFVTLTGTALAIMITAPYAYTLAHRKVRYQNILAFMTYFTMIFGAGLIGFYLLVSRWLGLKDTIWAMIFPYMLNPFYTFILIAYYRQLPFEINEAAIVEGAGEISIFYKIIWPISLPVIATVALFYSLQYWNDWWLALLFIDKPNLHPLQMMLFRLISSLSVSQYISGGTGYREMVPSKGIQLATVCVTIGPIIFAYPYVQKHFIKGITLGAVKG